MNKLKKACKGTFNILKSSELKARLTKLSLVLCLLFITYFVPAFRWVMLAVLSVYIACEYSASSLIWVALGAVTIPYTNLVGDVGLYFILMGEILAVYAVKIIVKLIKKEYKFSGWQFITLSCLYFAFSLILLLPLAETYSFGSQLSLWYFVTFLMGTLLFIKEIDVKNFLFSLVVTLIGICLSFLIAGMFKVGLGTTFGAHYSKGMVYRFMPFQADPNFSCGILLIGIMALFILYKQKRVNRPVYFSLLTILGLFYLRTLSKAGILVLSVFALYVIIDIIVASIKAKNSKLMLELVWYVLALGLVCLIEWQFVDALFNRLTGTQEGWWNQDAGSNAVDNLTTGRATLWIGYLKAIFTTPRILLFGAGMKAPYISQGAAHSTPIAYLYRIGLIEVLILVAIFIVNAIPYIKKAKLFNFVPLVLITMFYCSVGSPSSKHMLIYIVSFMTLCYTGLQYQVKER